MDTDDVNDTRPIGGENRWARGAQRVEGWVAAALETVPGLRRAIDDLMRVEFLDRALVIAAQSLFAMVPLLVVMAAFTPDAMRNTVFDQLGNLMSLDDTALGPVRSTMSVEQVRTQTGLVGIVVVFISATSYARALQRLYERTWELPHRGGFPGIRRCLVWLIGCLAYLQILAFVLASVSASSRVAAVAAGQPGGRGDRAVVVVGARAAAGAAAVARSAARRRPDVGGSGGADPGIGRFHAAVRRSQRRPVRGAGAWCSPPPPGCWSSAVCSWWPRSWVV